MQKVIRPSLSEQDILIKNNLRVLKKLSHFATNASEDLIISRFFHPSAKTENLIRRIFSAITVTYQFQTLQNYSKLLHTLFFCDTTLLWIVHIKQESGHSAVHEEYSRLQS